MISEKENAFLLEVILFKYEMLNLNIYTEVLCYCYFRQNKIKMS